MCVMDIMNVLRTGINMSISCIHIWLYNSCCMYVRAGRPAFARPYAGVKYSKINTV